MKNRKTLKFNNKKIYLNVYKYEYNNRLAIIAELEDEPYLNVTTNLANCRLQTFDYGFIDTMAKSSGLEKHLLKEGIIKRIMGIVPYNHEEYELVQFNIDKLKEYDPNGVEEYIKSYEEEQEIEE